MLAVMRERMNVMTSVFKHSCGEESLGGLFINTNMSSSPRADAAGVSMTTTEGRGINVLRRVCDTLAHEERWKEPPRAGSVKRGGALSENDTPLSDS